MTPMSKKILFALLLLVAASFRPPGNAVTCKDVMFKMIAATQAVRSLRYDLKIDERVKGKQIIQESSVKLMPKPLKIYMKIKQSGVEILFLAGKNNGDALVNPNGFPYVNLNLSPYGSKLRNGQHHTLYESGYDYFANLLLASMKTVGNNFDKYFSLQGDVKCQNRNCYCVNVNYPDFHYADHTVRKGENLNTIARAKNVSEFMILEANEDKVSFYDEAKEGMVLKVPNVYAKKITLYIDKENFLPVSMMVYDDKGLFESYDYSNLQVNTEIKDAEFAKGYPGYGF